MKPIGIFGAAVLFTLVTYSGFGTHSVFAADQTYNLVSQQGQNGSTLTGTITTDGVQGLLGLDDLKTYDVTVQDGSLSYTESGSDFYVNQPYTLTSGSTGLSISNVTPGSYGYFGFAETPSYESGYVPDPPYPVLIGAEATYLSGDFPQIEWHQPSGANDMSYGVLIPPLGIRPPLPYLFATPAPVPAPEPATLTLLAAALLGLGVVYVPRRRAMR